MFQISGNVHGTRYSGLMSRLAFSLLVNLAFASSHKSKGSPVLAEILGICACKAATLPNSGGQAGLFRDLTQSIKFLTCWG